MRLMAEQHAIGGGERQRVGGRLFPGEMLGALHELAVLHAAELGEGAVRRLIAPDALRGREHRVAAVALLVVPVVLVAVDDDLVADLPALDLGADRPDDAGGVGAGDVIGELVDVEHRDRLAERGPDAIVIDAGRHHQNQHVMAVELPGGHHLELHRLLGRPVPLLADDPGVHLGGHVPERRNLADVVEVFQFGQRRAPRELSFGRRRAEAVIHIRPSFRLNRAIFGRGRRPESGGAVAVRISAMRRRAEFQMETTAARHATLPGIGRRIKLVELVRGRR